MTRLEEMKMLAMEEAVKLKEHAHKSEISKLDFETFDSGDTRACIYGQMTGNCNSKRAQELIMLCCQRVYDAQQVKLNIPKEAFLNGLPFFVEGRGAKRSDKYQSPIEMFIYDEHGGEEAQQKLIAFLKDETQTLEL